MYDDYKVVYESKLNEYLIFWIILGVVALICFALVLISTSRVLKKAGRSPILGFIPIYNLIPSLEITNMEKKYFIPLIIPIVNLPFWLMLNLELAKFFKKNRAFGIGLTVLPFIFYPILAYSDSEYIGINLVAMDNTNSTNTIPMIDDEKNTLIEKEVNDEMDIATNTSSISLGGGKYQKDYKQSLMSVEDSMIARGEVQKAKPKPKPELIRDGKFFNSSLIQEEPTQQAPTNPQSNDLFNVSFINGQQPAPAPTNNQNITPATSQPSINMPGVAPASSQPSIAMPNAQPVQQPVQPQVAQSVQQPVQPVQQPVQPVQQPVQPVPQPQPMQQPTMATNNQIPIQQPQPVQQQPNSPVDLLRSNAPAAPAGPKLCPNCKTRVADNAKICMICGQKL